jgi:hypothetical protein
MTRVWGSPGATYVRAPNQTTPSTPSVRARSRIKRVTVASHPYATKVATDARNEKYFAIKVLRDTGTI